MNDEVLINKDDLETIDNNMIYLSNNLDNVTANVSQIEGRLDQVSRDFSSLQDNIKQTVMETQRTTLVLNAKQTIMLLRQEYDRKYRYRDEIRRKVKGLIKAQDINVLKRETISLIGEEAIINSPNYWLTPALLALCSWYIDDQEGAKKYLQEALKQDAETTALLMCFIHIRAKRMATATKWLYRYLGMQNPMLIDGKIVLIFEAITSGIFDSEMQKICLDTFNEWIRVLNQYPEYKNKQYSKWENKFTSYQEKSQVDGNPYVDKFVENKIEFNNKMKRVAAIDLIMEDFKEIMNKDSSKKEITNDKIDKLLDLLIYNCDREERELHNSIVMNEYIIKSNGDVMNAKKAYENDLDFLNDYQDFYTHVTNIALCYQQDRYSINTIKMAIAFSKEIILKVYQKVINLDRAKQNEVKILIEDYQGVTTDGSNERELVKEMNSSLDKKFFNEVYSPKLLGLNNIISFIILILLIIFCHKYWLILLLGIVFVLIYNGVIIYKRYRERQVKIGQLNEIKKDHTIVLLNTIAEIVDGYFMIEDKIAINKNFISYLNGLNYQDYFTKTSDDNYRNILQEEH